jgi:tetratricopeptide (TPR) repeat protein
MAKTRFSSYDEDNKRVFLFSVGISLAVVAGAWLYNNQKIATIKKISFINEQKTLNELDITAHQITAARYLQNGNPRKAIPHLQRILIYNNKDQLNHINLAHAFLEAGEYQNAYDIYTRIDLEDLPESTSSSICTRKGIALYYLGRKDESRNVLNQCLTQFPQSAEGYCFLVRSNLSKGDSSKALSLLEKAVQLIPVSLKPGINWEDTG